MTASVAASGRRASPRWRARLPIVALLVAATAAAAEGWIFTDLLRDPAGCAALLPLHASVASATGLFAAILHRAGQRDPMFPLFAISTAFLGPIGAAGTAVCALLRYAFSKRATPFAEWHASLFPVEAVSGARALHEDVMMRGRGPAKRSTVAPFADVIRLGSLREKQAVLSLVAERYRPPFATALRAALGDAEPVVRVQAAAAVARIESGFLQRTMALEKRRSESPDDLDLLLTLARLYDEQSATGLLGAERAFESAERALGFYLRLAPTRPGAAEAAARLLLNLGRAEEALLALEAAPAGPGGAGAAPGALALRLECLFRLRRFVELRDACRLVPPGRRGTALPEGVSDVARLWANHAATADRGEGVPAT